jgi:hypothetical protein
MKNIVAQHQVEQWEEEEGMETTLPKKIQDSVGNEENGYPAPNPNKTMIDDTKEPSYTYKTILKEEILQVSLRTSWRKY